MNDWLTELEAIIAGAPAEAEAAPERLARLEEQVAARPEEASRDQALLYLEQQLEKSGEHSVWLRYARALLQEEAGNAAAGRGYVRVAEQLGKLGAWPGARQALRRALGLHADQELISMLLRNSRHLGPEERAADLELANSLAPASAPVTWAQAQAARDCGLRNGRSLA